MANRTIRYTKLMVNEVDVESEQIANTYHRSRVEIHRVINDSGTSVSELWSAFKINAAVGDLGGQVGMVRTVSAASTMSYLADRLGDGLEISTDGNENIQVSTSYTGDFFTKAEHIDASLGSVDAGKPIILDADGIIDSSMLEFNAFDFQGVFQPTVGTEYPVGTTSGEFWQTVNVGAGYTFLTGNLAGSVINNDDLLIYTAVPDWVIIPSTTDMSNYLLVDGTRPMTAELDLANSRIVNVADGINGTDAVNMDQLAGQGFSDLIHRDGSIAMTGDFSVGNNYIHNLYPGSADTDATNVDQVTVMDSVVLSTANSYTDTTVGTHTTRTDNPHAVTKDQVGLSLLTNYNLVTTYPTTGTYYASAAYVNSAIADGNTHTHTNLDGLYLSLANGGTVAADVTMDNLTVGNKITAGSLTVENYTYFENFATFIGGARVQYNNSSATAVLMYVDPTSAATPSSGYILRLADLGAGHSGMLIGNPALDEVRFLSGNAYFTENSAIGGSKLVVGQLQSGVIANVQVDFQFGLDLQCTMRSNEFIPIKTDASPSYSNLGHTIFRWGTVYSQAIFSDQGLYEQVDETATAVPMVTADWIYSLVPTEYTEDSKTRFGMTATATESALFADYPAQDVVRSYIDGYSGSPVTHYKVNMTQVIPAMVKIIQEQKDLIDDLIARVTALETP